MKNANRPSGLIFDLGDTLMYIPRSFQFEPRLAQLLEISVAEVNVMVCDLYCSNVGLSADDFVRLLCQKMHHERFSIDDNEIREICMDSVREAKLQPDAIEALAVLRERGFKLTLVSNTSPLSWPRIEQLGLAGLFDHIVFSCDIGHLKPDPRIFMHAFERMGARASEVCLVGDKIRTLILGGAILGARLILVERRMHDTVMTDQVPTYAIVPSLRELVQLPVLIS